MSTDSLARRRLLIGVVLHTDVTALVGTLGALAEAVRDGDRIVLVPDGPDPATAHALCTDPRLRPIEQWGWSEPRGNPAAFNRLAAGRTDQELAVLLLENGARPAPDALDRLARVLDDSGVGLAGPSTNDAWNEQCALPGGSGDPAGLIGGARHLAELYGDGHRSLAPLHSITEFCVAVAAETLEAVGSADEGFGLGPCWEMEYAARAARAGLPAVWVEAAYVHRHGPTRRRVEQERRWFPASRQRYQNRLCGLRLSGERAYYAPHCSGETCAHFAPADRIVVQLPLGSHVMPQPTPPVPAVERNPVVVPADPPVPATVVRPRTGDLVSCIMPTADRSMWVARAIAYFHRQDHSSRELIVVDDGSTDLRDECGPLLDHPSITHVRLSSRASIGAKRNIGCGRARGDFLVHWDDDDWHGPDRISRQLAPLLSGSADITGLRDAIWFDVADWSFRRPRPGLHRRLFVGDVHGGTLAFKRAVWDEGVKYPNTSLAEDAWFVRNAMRRGARLQRLVAANSYIYIRHGTNSWQLAPPYDRADEWEAVAEPPELVGDRAFYAANSCHAPASPPNPDVLRPMVSCVMPTADRHEFLPAAITSFQAQRYEDAELLVVDDGTEPCGHLVPADPRIRYLRLDRRYVLGAKRNLSVAEARGEVIVHFDDDDWSHPERVRIQVDALRAGTAELCGLARMLWWDPLRHNAWRYTCPTLRRPWVAGNTLAYLRSAWERAPFPDQTVGEDTAFVWGLPTRRAFPIDDERLVIGTLHDNNTSAKHTGSADWARVDSAVVQRVLDEAGMGALWAS